MTLTSVTQANSKTAEFARLFDLFDRVASRRARAIAGDTPEVISADDIAGVPAEFAPVLNNLSTILSIRALRDEEPRRAQQKPTGRPRRNTVAIAPSTVDGGAPVQDLERCDGAEAVDSPSFPLGERYPFTFKLMLHKLYDLDEWAEKVKNAVEASKSQFKPLAERFQNVVREATGKEKVEKRRVARSRSHSVLGSGAKSKLSIAPRPPPTSSACPEVSRVLKKRCIGRRKSLGGLMSTNVWVYDAAISAVEVTGPRPSVEITLSAPRDTTNTIENRSRSQSLAGLEGIQARETARRKIKIAVLSPDVIFSCSVSKFTEPLGHTAIGSTSIETEHHRSEACASHVHKCEERTRKVAPYQTIIHH
ncbi:hypothetical protein BU15DRAFT_86074 [Melanogaster broomeanus]|nr:hypothetical protein BU15DRAFT_86074 [Melanogaster broomeanus]